MNIPFVLKGAIKRFAARCGSPRVVEKTTCVFILGPLDFRQNGHAKKPELEPNLIENRRHDTGAWTGLLSSTLSALDRAALRVVPDEDLNNTSNLNYDLMWTWFLPNPLWLAKRSEGHMALRRVNR